MWFSKTPCGGSPAGLAVRRGVRSRGGDAVHRRHHKLRDENRACARLREVILQERAPRLRRWPPTAHVLANAGLTDVDAEFEQLPMDAWRGPERILAAHLADQLADVVQNRWSSWPA